MELRAFLLFSELTVFVDNYKVNWSSSMLHQSSLKLIAGVNDLNLMILIRSCLLVMKIEIQILMKMFINHSKIS